MKLTKMHELNFEQLKNRLQSVVQKLDKAGNIHKSNVYIIRISCGTFKSFEYYWQLVTRVTVKTELAMFLTNVCTNFRWILNI